MLYIIHPDQIKTDGTITYRTDYYDDNSPTSYPQCIYDEDTSTLITQNTSDYSITYTTSDLINDFKISEVKKISKIYERILKINSTKTYEFRNKIIKTGRSKYPSGRNFCKFNNEKGRYIGVKH